MRTTLDLDDGLMDALMAKYPGRTKTAAVEAAIVADLEGNAAAGLRAMAGRVEVEDRRSDTRAAEKGRGEQLRSRWHGDAA